MDESQTINYKQFLKDNPKFELLLDEKQFRVALESEGYIVDEDEFIINKETKERVLANDGGEIKLGELGGVLPGSKIFVKKNLAGFAQYFQDFGF